MNGTQSNARLEGQQLTGRVYASWRADLLTVVLGLWLIAGLFVDGYAHNNLRGTLETFFTPWHAVLYSGFTACAAWIAWLTFQQAQAGRRGLNAIPVGYEWGLAGVFIFGLGGLGDMIWHTVFGIEVGTNALLSPTHLLLLTGGVLILGSPLRSAWLNLGAARAPSILAFLPALLSVFGAYSFIVFMHMYSWGMTSVPDSKGYVDWLVLNGGNQTLEQLHRQAASGILFSNVIMIGAALLLLRRWKTPFGTFTLLYGVNTLMMSVMLEGDFALGSTVPALLAGVMADLLVRLLEPRPERIVEWRVFAGVVPLLIWGFHFAGIAWLGSGIGLNREFWTGITVMAGLSGLLLSVLVTPTSAQHEPRSLEG